MQPGEVTGKNNYLLAQIMRMSWIDTTDDISPRQDLNNDSGDNSINLDDISHDHPKFSLV
jgi:hypothetical protein